MKNALLSLTLWTTLSGLVGYYLGTRTQAPVVVNNYYHYSEPVTEGHVDYYYSHRYEHVPIFLMLPQEKTFQPHNPKGPVF
jgi:hypothetical protein